MNTPGRACWFARSDAGTAPKVIEYLADVMVVKGVPEHIRSDNGPEFVAKDLREVARGHWGKDTLHRAGVSMGERLLRIVQFQAARRVPERRDLLLSAEGGADTGRTLAGSLQHHQATLFARRYRSPAPETWQTEIKTGYGEVESKVRFPLPHTPDGDVITNQLVALN